MSGGVYLFIKVIMGAIAAAIASSKGRNVVGWFFGGFFLDLIGVIIVAVLSNLKEEQHRHERSSRERRRLREQLMQERLKNEAFRRHAASRLDSHDRLLGVDTKETPGLSAGEADAPHLEQGPRDPEPPPAGKPRQWYYELEGEPKGPVSEVVMRRMLKAGELPASTLVWTQGMTDWQPANELRRPGAAES